MPQNAHKTQQENIRIPLTREQAIEIAKKSHQRLKAQREEVQPETKPAPTSTQQPTSRIQVPLVKRAVNINQVSTPNTTSNKQQTRQEEESENQPVKYTGRFGMHRTKSGAPDRRFVENQHLSAEEAEVERAKMILKRMGIKTD